MVLRMASSLVLVISMHARGAGEFVRDAHLDTSIGELLGHGEESTGKGFISMELAIVSADTFD